MKAMKFKLEISMGDDAMSTENDVAEAILKVARKLMPNGPVQGVIHDVNGNRVGEWKFTGVRR